MTEKLDVTFTVNGESRSVSVEPRRTLADALREDCGLTGTIWAASTASAAPARCCWTVIRCVRA